MNERVTEDELAATLIETGRRHHQAFRESDGADPEWASWYAADIQARLWDRLGSTPTRSELVYLLIGAERSLRESGSAGGDWPAAYARFMLEHLPAG